jgi:prepilin-type N-terminal cleavage/methylation domain-containing protein
MKRLNRGEKGMTLIELMVVMSLIGVLISVAIPAFKNYKLNSKRAEAYSNLSAIAKAEKSVYAEFGEYVSALAEPWGENIPGTERHDPDSVTAEFASIGWNPEGQIYFSYDVATSSSAASGEGAPPCALCTGDCFTATAYSDLDGNGVLAYIIYAQPDNEQNFCTTWLNDEVDVPIAENGSRMLSQVVRVPAESGISDDY